jgi:hypothetical protein
MSTFSTCTSTTRPGSPTDGDVLFETDTKNIIVYDGTNWRGYQNDGATGWSGVNDYYMSTDGVDDYVRLGYDIGTVGTGDVTLSFWVKPENTPNSFVTISDLGTNADRVGISRNSSGKIFSSSRTGSLSNLDLNLTGATTVNVGTWYHVAWVRVGDTQKLYVNGSQDATGSTTGSATTYGDTISLGEISWATSIKTPTNIDEVSIFESELSADQIDNIYHGLASTATQTDRDNVTTPAPGNLMTFNPAAWYRMGDGAENGSGVTVYDMSSNNYNATVGNGASYNLY